MTTVYEISVFDFILKYFVARTLPFLIGFILIIILMFKIRKSFKEKPDSPFVKSVKKEIKHPKALGYVLACILPLMFVSLLIFNVSTEIEYIGYINQYIKKDYSVVQGNVSEFSPYMGKTEDTKPPFYGKRETFYVGNAFFDYFPNQTFGYEIPASQGGFVYENGQKLKISYITDLQGVNHIMKLEIEKSVK